MSNVVLSFQLESISSKLLQGFVEWIEINDDKDIALILDSAYEFKYSILNLKGNSLQKKYFIKSQDLTSDEIILLINQWKETFSKLMNSGVDRVVKDSFKIWFLTLAAYGIPSLTQRGETLWFKLIEGIPSCEKFSLSDIPHPYNKITKN